MTRIADLKKRLMGNPEFKAEYEKANAEFARIEVFILARAKAKAKAKAKANPRAS